MSEGIRELKEKAQTLLSKRQHQKALDVFHKVVELAPDDVFALKKTAELLDLLGEKQLAANRFVQLSEVFNKDGRRLQAIASCKLALTAVPGWAAAEVLLAEFYEHAQAPRQPFQLNQASLTRGSESMSTQSAQDAETFVDALSALCALFSATQLEVQPQSLAESVAGQTDFLWLVQFTGAAEHSVIIAAQRRFVYGTAQRVLDIDAEAVTEAMAIKLSNKLIGMYADDVKRVFGQRGRAVQSSPPIPISGENATYQLSGTRALHVPLCSDIGWVQLTIAGGV